MLMISQRFIDMPSTSVFSKTFEKNYISKSIVRNMSEENNSTGRKQNEKTFNFVNKGSNEAKASDKYSCNLTKNKDDIEIKNNNKKINSNFYK